MIVLSAYANPGSTANPQCQEHNTYDAHQAVLSEDKCFLNWPLPTSIWPWYPITPHHPYETTVSLFGYTEVTVMLCKGSYAVQVTNDNFWCIEIAIRSLNKPTFQPWQFHLGSEASRAPQFASFLSQLLFCWDNWYQCHLGGTAPACNKLGVIKTSLCLL